MAHLNAGQMKIMAAKELITGKDIPGTGKLSFCAACAEGKAHRAPVKPVGEIKSTRMLELVHSDVARPMKTESFGDAKYVVTFVDDYSRCVTVYQIVVKCVTVYQSVGKIQGVGGSRDKPGRMQD
jgi:hypothetical protein